MEFQLSISNSKRWCCESAALNMLANLENSAVAEGLEMVSFHSNPKERQCQRMLKLPHNCTHLSQFSSIAQSCLTLCDPMDCSTPGLPVHHQLPGFTQTNVHWWCHPTISSSVVPFSSHLQFFPASGSSPVIWLFVSGGQNIGASATVLPMNI